MKFVNLKPVVLTYTETFEYSVDDYIEDCEDGGIVPSQKHYDEPTNRINQADRRLEKAFLRGHEAPERTAPARH